MSLGTEVSKSIFGQCSWGKNVCDDLVIEGTVLSVGFDDFTIHCKKKKK